MRKKHVAIFLVAAWLCSYLVTPAAAAPLDYSFWANPITAMDYGANTIDFNVTSVPSQPYAFSWGKDGAVTKDKVYRVTFDAQAVSYTSNPLVPISLKIHQKYAPYAWRSEEKIIQIDGTLKPYTVDLYATASDSDVVLAVWVGWAAATYHFANVAVTEITPTTPIEAYPLDFTWWANGLGSINYGFGIVNFDLPTKPTNPYDAIWGKNLSVTAGKTYRVSFDAKAESYITSTTPKISLRIVQNYSPWQPYTSEPIASLYPIKQHYEFDLISTGSDTNAVLTVLAGHNAAKYEFSNINIVEQPGTTPVPPPLNYSYWANPIGAINYGAGTIDFDVMTKPSQPYQHSWGKDMAVIKDKIYRINFNARANSYTSATLVPISLKIHQKSSPYAWRSEEKIIQLDNTLKPYEVDLYATAADMDAVLVVWVGWAASTYHFENITVTEITPTTPIEAYPLDFTWWANGLGSINYGFGIVNFDLMTKPAYPYDAIWGKNMSVMAGKTYRIKFDAKAQSYTSSPTVPISLRIVKNYSPWTPYTSEPVINLTATKATYQFDLAVSGSDANAALTVLVGHAAANYEFSNISITQLP